jgi:hypothetical protein
MPQREKPSFYSVMPATVRYCKDLSPQEKLLYSEITALANKEGYCWATNTYFADLFGLHKITVSKQISRLAEYGFVRIETVYRSDSKQIQERRIYVSSASLKNAINSLANTPISKNVNTPISEITPISENANTPIDKNVYTPVSKNANTPISENAKDNITRFNNTRKNNTSMNNQSIINPINHPVARAREDGLREDRLTDEKIDAKTEVKKPLAVKKENIKENIQENAYNRQEVTSLIKDNIGYDAIINNTQWEARISVVDEIIEIMTDAVCSHKSHFVISGEEIPSAIVRSTLLKLNLSHIEYVIDSIGENSGNIKRIDAYLLKSLLNSPKTIKTYEAIKNREREQAQTEQTQKPQDGVRRKSSFCNFTTQRKYDWAEIERLEQEYIDTLISNIKE